MCLLGVDMTFKGNSLCLSGQSTVLARCWLHHCSYTESSCPEKTRFTFSCFLLLLNEDLAIVVHASVTFRMNYCNVFYPKGCKKVKMKAVADYWCSGSLVQKRSSVVCISFSPSYRTDSGYWSPNMLCPSYHNDNLKIQKRNNKLNFDRNIVFKTWSLLKHCTGSVSSQLSASFLVYRAAS